MSTSTPIRRIVGCMTGTSIDALDAALIEVHGHGLSMHVKFARSHAQPLGDLAAPLRRLASGEPMSAGSIADLSLRFGLFHERLIAELLGGERADLIVVHGQTVFHQPPVSWQLINPAPIAARLGIPVLFDLRQADLAAGGQGAPITPIADWILFQSRAGGPERGRAIVNLGGFCNVTIIPNDAEPAHIRGLDVCACNHVLDAVARRALGAPFDADGAAAAAGQSDELAVDRLVTILMKQSRGGRSLGTGDEASAWIETFADQRPPQDLAACATEAVARVIASAIPSEYRAFAAGGGTRHLPLMRLIGQHMGRACSTTDELGIPAQDREAIAMAVLGALCQDSVPITLPAVTGCTSPAPISGAWVLP